MTTTMTQTETTADEAGYSMEAEIAVDFDDCGEREYVEVGVEEGDDVTTVYCEDAEGSVSLRLSLDEMDDLIESLIRARDVAAKNR